MPDWISAADGSDYCLLDEQGHRLEIDAAPPDANGLVGLARRVSACDGNVPVRAAIESMNGARFVHDALERQGWNVEVADAQKVKGLAPLLCKTDRIGARVLAELRRRRSGSRTSPGASSASAPASGLFSSASAHRSSTAFTQLLAFGHPCPVSDPFARRGRELLERWTCRSRGWGVSRRRRS